MLISIETESRICYYFYCFYSVSYSLLPNLIINSDDVFSKKNAAMSINYHRHIAVCCLCRYVRLL